MNNAQTFRDVIAWQKSHQFVLSVYALTQSFPKHETFGLTAQLRRAAVSIPANIAEGFRRRSLTEKARFLNIAESSLEECRYYLILAKDLNYANTEPQNQALEAASQLLCAYTKAIRRRAQIPEVPY